MKFNILGIAAAAFVAGAALTSQAQAETSIRALAAWPTSLTQVNAIFHVFEDNVTKASGGEIKFENNGPEVVPPFEQFQPLSAGVFDMVFSAANYHQSDTGVGVVIDLLKDLKQARESGVMDYINDYYRKNFDIEVLAVVFTSKSQITLREPLTEGSGLAGRKIKSGPLYDGVLRAVGAVPVAMNPYDAYAAMEKGTIDGIAFPMHVAADLKLYEVSKYMTRPGFGQSSIVLMVNASKFAALPEGLQSIIREQALKMEEEGTRLMQKLGEDQSAIMQQNGVAIAELSPEVAKTIEDAFGAGAKEIARKSATAAVDALLEFATQKGALKY